MRVKIGTLLYQTLGADSLLGTFGIRRTGKTGVWNRLRWVEQVQIALELGDMAEGLEGCHFTGTRCRCVPRAHFR